MSDEDRYTEDGHLLSDYTPEELAAIGEESEAKDKILLYRELADGLRDMVESGRLVIGDIPDDYDWLVRVLAKIAGGKACVKCEEVFYDNPAFDLCTACAPFS